jgi:integrase
MTAPSRAIASVERLQQDTPVFLNRKHGPGAMMPKFGDSRWHMTLALLEAHAPSMSIGWEQFPAPFRDAAKHYIWFLINFQPTPEDITEGRIRLAVRTIVDATRPLSAFLGFMADRGRFALKDVNGADMNDYATAVAMSDISVGRKHLALKEALRLWQWREWLPADFRLPAQVPWGGRTPKAMLGEGRKDWENRTPMIDELTMSALLTWSLRFVEIFATDIVPAATRHGELWRRAREYDGRYSRRRGENPDRSAFRLSLDQKRERATDLVLSLKENGMKLPGREVDGKLELDLAHIRRLLGVPNLPRDGSLQSILLRSGLPLDDHAALVPPKSPALLDGEPWVRRQLAFNEVLTLERHLRTACVIVIAYLSGMRPGEVLSLRRGCVGRIGELWVVEGRTYKSAKNDDGEKLAEGEIRDVPWVVVKPVSEAVQVMESLHEDELLFPSTALRKEDTVDGRARRSHEMGEDIKSFSQWVNEYCSRNGRPDVIPTDKAHPRINLFRFRRTLAWHICRRPRGLVATAIQYGHVLVQVSQGYGGDASSGFPDEYSFERFLARVEDLSTAQERLARGEHVSGPAAARYKTALQEVKGKFTGMFITTGKQARAILANPSLQIYEGKGMTCVYDPARALCRFKRLAADPTSTPDLSDCRSGCQNIARTDGDIVTIAHRISLLEAAVMDPLAPPIRAQRERAELERSLAIVDGHESTKRRSGE